MKQKIVLALVFIVLLLSMTGCASEEVTIYFLDGSTVSCNRVELGDVFTICTHIDGIRESQETFRSESIESVR